MHAPHVCYLASFFTLSSFIFPCVFALGTHETRKKRYKLIKSTSVYYYVLKYRLQKRQWQTLTPSKARLEYQDQKSRDWQHESYSMEASMWQFPKLLVISQYSVFDQVIGTFFACIVRVIHVCGCVLTMFIDGSMRNTNYADTSTTRQDVFFSFFQPTNALLSYTHTQVLTS